MNSFRDHVWIFAPILGGLVVLAGIWFVGHDANPGPVGFRLDDAWIHLVYGRSIAQEGILAYNPGVPTTGCTSPLWAILLGILHRFVGVPSRPDDVLLSRLIGSIFVVSASLHLLCIGCIAATARRLTASKFQGALAGSLVALATPWAASAFSGMEVVLAGTLLSVAVGAVVHRRVFVAGLALALAALARPESAIVTLACALLFGVEFARRRGRTSEPPRSSKDRALRAGEAGRPTKDRASMAREAQGSSPRPDLLPFLHSGRDFFTFLAPSVVFGFALVAFHVSVTGSPFPATFAAKSSIAWGAFSARIGTAFTQMMNTIPPWTGGVGWLALGGYFFLGRRRDAMLLVLPLVAGLLYLLGNLAILDPADPAAFYHLRYVLPAVPLLACATALGASLLGTKLPPRFAPVPSALLAAIAVVGAAATVSKESRHLHNDVRNINEVQRSLGAWIEEFVPKGDWVAAADAGAIRYIGDHPTIDVLGLNTPEMRTSATAESYIRSHPVQVLALMPAWFQPESAEGIEVVYETAAQDYTVTSNPKMALQVIVAADSAASAAGKPLRVSFRGFRRFEVEMAPAEMAR